MTEQQRITLRRLATDLEPFIEALERTSRLGHSEVATPAQGAAAALRLFVASVVRSRK